MDLFCENQFEIKNTTASERGPAERYNSDRNVLFSCKHYVEQAGNRV